MTSKPTILIGDDEPEMRDVLEEYFVARGYATLSAETAGVAGRY